jgi:hypothetical protein
MIQQDLEIFLSTGMPYPGSCSMGDRDSFLECKWQRHELTAHLDLVLRLRMTGAIPVIPSLCIRYFVLVT